MATLSSSAPTTPPTPGLPVASEAPAVSTGQAVPATGAAGSSASTPLAISPHPFSKAGVQPRNKPNGGRPRSAAHPFFYYRAVCHQFYQTSKCQLCPKLINGKKRDGAKPSHHVFCSRANDSAEDKLAVWNSSTPLRPKYSEPTPFFKICQSRPVDSEACTCRTVSALCHTVSYVSNL